ncbi:MAG: DEAD/DEAH box helicase [Planctomycetes bacterium]|nr:DEAD/DEAH box helicase [Planctomycetota bacterium]MCB9905820.1 DEAD/DEAH box helicase [Planctomycetota bacterium]
MKSKHDPEEALGNGAGVSAEPSLFSSIESSEEDDRQYLSDESAAESEEDVEEEADEASETEPSSPFAALPDPLAATMTARGFRELTQVQIAALEAVEKGRDLRITSQTGSGKTVALGIVMAPSLVPERGEKNIPRALVIAPTRELASQVREELDWLFAELPDASVECVTGGTSVFHERKRLARGPRVLVGTPGRLVDHLRSRALDLSGVREVVLDEADQMLDMGFRDELEAILDATPADRRTHMVSATFPPGVARLAERYQTEAHSIEGTQLGQANEDIEHIGHVMQGDDRYGVLVNTLLLAEGGRALVFVPTRADAARLSESLAKDGFGALALSGDLQQAQRTRTLAAFKNGTVSVLVATDVAARGLDVPDVEVVVHYAPPSEGENYVHRAGRTGRAGNKGTSILFAPANRRRRIERLLEDEGVSLEWRDLPSADYVRAELAKRDTERLREAIGAEATEEQLANARLLLEDRDPAQVVAALVERARPTHAREPIAVRSVGPRDRHDRPERSSERYERPQRSGEREERFQRSERYDRNERNDRPERGDGPREERPAKRFQRNKPGFTRFFVSWGFQYGATPGRLMALICRRGEITSRDVGAIDMGPRGTTFEVADAVARDFEAKAALPDERDPRIRIRRDFMSGGDGAPPRGDSERDGGRNAYQRRESGGGRGGFQRGGGGGGGYQRGSGGYRGAGEQRGGRDQRDGNRGGYQRGGGQRGYEREPRGGREAFSDSPFREKRNGFDRGRR